MNPPVTITHLFLDIGGVLLTNGWDHVARQRAAEHFALDLADLEARHHLTFDTFEEGKITLEEYLQRVIFHRARAFTEAEFRTFMLAQSTPDTDMIALMRRLKAQYGLKVAVVSNEGRELNQHRINTFQLNTLVDAFISSCFVHLRKPDIELFQLALDISQADAAHVIYIENTPMFVQVAESLGIRSILHVDYATTRAHLATLGLSSDNV